MYNTGTCLFKTYVKLELGENKFASDQKNHSDWKNKQSRHPAEKLASIFRARIWSNHQKRGRRSQPYPKNYTGANPAQEKKP
jgi:hypothetical protein